MTQQAIPQDKSRQVHEAIINDPMIKALNNLLFTYLQKKPIPPMELTIKGVVENCDKDPFMEKIGIEIKNRMSEIINQNK